MKKRTTLLSVIMLAMMLTGCYSESNKCRSPRWENFLRDPTFEIDLVTADDIEKITLGMPMKEVYRILGRGFLAEGQAIHMFYSTEKGETYTIYFFELEDFETLGENRNGVTGIYYSYCGKEYFLMPKALKGKSLEDAFPPDLFTPESSE